MKKYSPSLILIFLLISGSIQAQQSLNIKYRSLWDDRNFSTSDPEIKYSSCWGWDDGKGHECAIFGSQDYTYFLDVSNPDQPLIVHIELGKAKQVIWREYRTYGKYVYAVNDGADGSLQIFDMSKFPASVSKVYDSDTLFARAHTLNIDHDRLYVHGARKKGEEVFTLGIFDLKNTPANPQVLAYYTNPEADYVHDAITKNDTVYAFSGYQGFYAYDARNPNAISVINTLQNYPGNGYCHSGALSADGRYLYMADEVPTNLPLKVFDVKDIQNINYVDSFRSNSGFTAHNPFVKGNLLFVSYYEDGVQVWNIADPKKPIRVAYFDTYPEAPNDAAPYHGCWNVYPYFPSGNIVAIDRRYGLYTLEMNLSTSSMNHAVDFVHSAYVYPNPARDQINLSLPKAVQGKYVLELMDMMGRSVMKYEEELPSSTAVLELGRLENLSSGIYTLQLQAASDKFVAKIIKE